MHNTVPPMVLLFRIAHFSRQAEGSSRPACPNSRTLLDRRRTTTCPCKAHTQAQAAVASWHKAHTEAQAALASGRKAYTEAQAALASWRKAHTEAQAAVASGHAPRQALLLDRAAAVR